MTDSERRQNQTFSNREVMSEAFLSFSSWKKILTSLALLSRSISHSVQTHINRLSAKELYFYDLIKKAFTLGLNPKIEFDEKGSRLKITFEGGYLQNAQVNLRSEGSDLQTFSQILLEQEYQPLIKLVGQRMPLEKIEYIVDAGANIGLTTVYLKRFFSQAKVVAIEPDNENFSMLSRNVESNKLNNVHLLEAGLWDKESSLEISRNFRDSLDWSVTLEEKHESKNQPDAIQGLPLSSVKQKFGFPRIDILKIDIEGSERFLFADEATALRTLDGVRYLALEIHDEFDVRPKIERMLVQNNFSFFEAGETVFAHRN